VRTAQHVLVGGAGVEPHVERVADLLVVRRFVAQQLGGVELEPGLDAFLLDALGHDFHQLDGARVQLAGFLVQEEGIGTPQLRWREMHQSGRLAIIAVQARLAPAGRTWWPRWRQRAIAQRGAAGFGVFIHADEPLRGGAIDERGLVAPAVHVAVLDGLGVQQRADFRSLSTIAGLAFQMNWPPKNSRDGAYTVAQHRLFRISSLTACRRRLHDTKSSTP
jgi:hypothetical protein